MLAYLAVSHETMAHTTHQSEMRLFTLPCSKPPTQALLGFTQRIGWQMEGLRGKNKLNVLKHCQYKIDLPVRNLDPLCVHRCHLDIIITN